MTTACRKIWLRAFGLVAPAAICVLAMLPAGEALAHDFGRNSDFYTYFVEGAGVVLNDVPMLVAALALGVFVSIWHPRGYPQVFAFLAAGMVAGYLLPLGSIESPGLFSLALAICAGLCGAVAPALPLALIRTAFVLAGGLLAAGALGGHASGTVPLGVYPGIFFMTLIAVSLGATATTIARERLPDAVALIAARSFSSWLVAMAVMMLALAFRQSGA